MKPQFKSCEEVEEWYLPFTKIDYIIDYVIKLSFEMTQDLITCEDFRYVVEDYWFGFNKYDLNIWIPGDTKNSIAIALYGVDENGTINYDAPVWRCKDLIHTDYDYSEDDNDIPF